MSINNAIITIDNTESYLFLDEKNHINFYIQNYTIDSLPTAKLIIKDAISGKDLYNSDWKINNSIFTVSKLIDSSIVAATEEGSLSGPFTVEFSFTELSITIDISHPLIVCLAITDLTGSSNYSNGVLKNVIKKGTASGIICYQGENQEDDKIDSKILYPDNYYSFKFEYESGDQNTDSLLSATYILKIGEKILQKEAVDFGVNTTTWEIPIRAALLEEALGSQSNQLTLTFAIDYITTKGYIDSYKKDINVNFDKNTLVDESFKLTNIEATSDTNKGVNIVTVEYSGTGYLIGNLQLFRKDLTNSKGWELVHEFSTKLQDESSVTMEDVIAEPGKPYLYKVMFYRRYFDGVKQSWVTTYLSTTVETTTPVILVTDDIFLITKKAILRIAYNPELTQFKRNVVDQITTTIGGAYPFVTRNGKQKHRTFTLGGLLSYNREVAALYTAENVLQKDSYHTGSITQNDRFANSTFGTFINEDYYTNLSPAIRETVYEKEFRNQTMDFLYDDNIILFKSMQEGNIIVRLTGVSMTPNAQLNRDIYSFTSQAVEVMENSVENCYEYFVTHADDKLVVYKDLYLKVLEYNQDTGTATIAKENYQGSNKTIIAYQLNKEG